MSLSQLTANDLINLGRSVCALINADNWAADDYERSRDIFLDLAKSCGFRDSVAAAGFLDGLKIARGVRGPNVAPGQASDLKKMCEGVHRVLVAEGLRTTVILTDIEPPLTLLNLPCPEPHHKALHDDLITCLKAHLARPAIVMAWALGYDLVRSWVYSDPKRLLAFNTQLAKARRSSEPTSIVDYHDYFRLGEYRFLEICRDSQDANLQRFTDRTFRDLHNLLDQRNDFAHANYATASPAEATAYVERMVRLITSPPFDK